MTILENIPLAPYTTFGIGGNAEFFTVVSSKEDLFEVLSFAEQRNIPFFILGGGSNILITDRGIKGLVIKIDLRGIHFEAQGDDILVTALAGEGWDAFVEYCVAHEWWGVENLSLIPGTVGASPVQNIGAYGLEVMDRIMSVEVFDSRTKQIKILPNEECEFGYRTSVFKKQEYKHLIITSVTFKLSKNTNPSLNYKDVMNFFAQKGISNPTLIEIRNAIIEIRTNKFPDLKRLGTAGSFFKNPIIDKAHYDSLQVQYQLIPGFEMGNNKMKVPLAWILDNVLHLKGFGTKETWLFEKQPLVIVAEKNTKAENVIALSTEVIKKVFEATKIKIEPEVEILF